MTKQEIIDTLVGVAMLCAADCWEVLNITSCNECPKVAECRIKQAMEEAKSL
jgi:hypothetical protein